MLAYLMSKCNGTSKYNNVEDSVSELSEEAEPFVPPGAT